MSDPLAFAERAPLLPLAQRRQLLLAWADALQADAEDLARAITAATRKPLRLARVEVERTLGTLRGTAAASERLAPQRVDLGRGHAWIHRQPLGPVLAVTPFNFPANLAMHKLAPALAAGCPVLLKPSPKAPGVAERLLAALARCGAPEGLVRLEQLADQQVAAVAADPRLALLSFTGSVAVGRRLQALATRARVVLELGGNAAVVLEHSADPAADAARIANGACAHAGQSCISVQRIFIPAGRDDLRAALVDAFRQVPAGDPWDERTVCGPVIDAEARRRIEALLDGYRASGGRLLTGGTWDGLVLAPTLVEGVDARWPGVRDQEAFAPLATLHAYTTLDEALAAVDDTPFGLQAGLFTDRAASVAAAFERLHMGALVVGDVPTLRDDRLPYGGVKDSGRGREGSDETALDYTEAKVLWHPHAPAGAP